MRRDLGTFLAWALRTQARGGPHGELARNVVLTVLLAQLLAATQHERPPHAARHPPRQSRPRRQRIEYRESLSGRRPRG